MPHQLFGVCLYTRNGGNACMGVAWRGQLTDFISNRFVGFAPILPYLNAGLPSGPICSHT